MAYSFRAAYESGAFLQKDLIDAGVFHRLARNAGIEVTAFASSFEELLEELDQAGAFCPIAFAPDGYEESRFHGRTGQPELIFREEVDFRPWRTYSWDDGQRDRVTALYSPWQLIYLTKALEQRSMTVPLALLRDRDLLIDAVERWSD